MKRYKYIILCLALFIFVSTITTNKSYGNENYTTKVPVLLYHHLLYDSENKDKKNAAIISVEQFSEQMKYLSDNGYTTISMEQMYGFLYNNEKLPLKSVLITFDDGYYSNYLYAYPILKEYGFKASFFIITSVVSEEERVFDPDAFTMLDRKSMEASKDVFTYYSHTDNTHEVVKDTSGFVFYDNDFITGDILKSFEMTDDTLAFAYPYGIYTDEKIEILKNLDVKLCFTTKTGSVTINNDPYLLPRWVVYPSYNIKKFAQILNS